MGKLNSLKKAKDKSISIKFPLKLSSNDAFAMNKSTIDAAADDLTMLVLTNHGERLIHFDYGANLRPLIFEQHSEDLKQKVADAIILAVNKWLPYVNIIDITVRNGQEDLSLGPNEISVNIEFSVMDVGVTKIISIPVRA